MTHPNDPSNYNDGIERCDECHEPLEFGVIGLPIYRVTPVKGPSKVICDTCLENAVFGVWIFGAWKMIECISGYGGKA